MPDELDPILKPRLEGQRRLLALDGGGIRGLITLGILEKIETDLRKLPGMSKSNLSDYFDFIGGTSTGAIIAAGLSIGLPVKDIIGFYRTSGKLMFEKGSLLDRAWNKYKSDPLQKELQNVLGATTTLGDPKLKTLLLIVTRNVTTDSPWPVTNNPLAKYNDRDRPDCNLDLPLWQLVRASTAAPVYFPPEVVVLGERAFVFVDGGVTPYNNPAFLMHRKVTSPAYRLAWKPGEKEMLILSVGTGSAPRLGPDARDPERNILGIAQSIAGEMMNGMAYDQDINCRVVGRCAYGPALDREVGDLVPDAPLDKVLGRQFLYVRYDPSIAREGLDDLGLQTIESAKVSALDAVDAMDDLLAVGRGYATKYVDLPKHFGGFYTRTGS